MRLTALTDELARARAEARLIDASALTGVVADVDDAYAVQSLLAKSPGHEVRGWKVTALATDQQRLYLADKPVAGALLARFVHDAPAVLSLKTFVTPLLECEVSFRLGHDLPPRDTLYLPQDIEAAVDAVVPAMEIADGRVAHDAPGLLKLADDMGNGAFITGAPLADWHRFDLTGIAVTLTHDGKVTQRGSSSRILGNPLLAVVALANAQSSAQPLPAGGLKRGQIVTTGTCTTPIPPQAGRYIAEFGPLGTMQLDVVA